MNYFKLDEFDSADGPGIRVGLYVSGCTHKCKGCHSSAYWCFSTGEKFDYGTVCKIKELLERPYCMGLSILGGDPLELENARVLAIFLSNLQYWHETHHEGKVNIWLWTGSIYEDLQMIINDNTGNLYSDEYRESLKTILENITVLVDGPFIESEKDLNLEFRGSKNQRLINMQKTLETGNVTLITKKGFEYV